MRKSGGIYHGWYLIAAGAFISMVSMGSMQAFGVFVLPMSDEFDWNRSTISIAIAMASLIGGASQPVMGRIFDRLGGRNLILTGILLTGASTLLLTFTNHIIFLVVFFGILGSLGRSAGGLNTLAALASRWFQRRRSITIAIISGGGSLGGLMIVPLVSFVMPIIGWRYTWTMLGLFLLALALPLAFILIKNDPKEVGQNPDGDPSEEGGDDSRRRVVRPGPLEVEYWLHAFKSAPMWQLLGGYMVCGITTNLISAHYVPYAVERGFSPAIAATAFGVLSAMNLLGVLGIGFLGDRFGRKNLLALVYGVRGLGFAILLLVPGVWGLFGFAIVAGMAWLATVPLTTSLTADVYGIRNIGVLSGLTFMAHQFGGAASIQIGGILRDITGEYTLVFTFAGLMLAFATVVSFLIRERSYSARYQPVAQPGAA